jgi:serine phosphatase RsbU (regulator of sigma subunit)
LGGDYYDFFKRPNELVVLVADVSGHGVQAALSSMVLKASFREAASQADGPIPLLDRMNTQLAKILPSSMYACAASLWITPDESRVRIANAGLPYPMVLRADSGRVDELALTGVPLALLPDVIPNAYDYREIELKSGDVLLLTSDGLGDVRNTKDEFFHDGPIGNALRELRGKPGAEVIDGLVKSATSFRKGEANPDDICVVTLTKQ